MTKPIVEIKTIRGVVGLVDAIDAELAIFRWSHYGRYLSRVALENGKKKTIYLHRAIADRLGFPRHLEVDHVDRNPLNCTRTNLRSATRSENERNKPGIGATGLRGISRVGERWRADVYLNRKRVWTSSRFKSASEAIVARNIAAREFHGEFAFLIDENAAAGGCL